MINTARLNKFLEQSKATINRQTIDVAAAKANVKFEGGVGKEAIESLYDHFLKDYSEHIWNLFTGGPLSAIEKKTVRDTNPKAFETYETELSDGRKATMKLDFDGRGAWLTVTVGGMRKWYLNRPEDNLHTRLSYDQGIRKLDIADVEMAKIAEGWYEMVTQERPQPNPRQPITSSRENRHWPWDDGLEG